MNRNVLLALMVWAIDRDLLKTSVSKAWELFQRDAMGICKNYTDPSDELLYCSNLIGKIPIEIMTDYTLCYAKMWVTSGIRSYGKYDKSIKNYKK